jgi:hypothetical protein
MEQHGVSPEIGKVYPNDSNQSGVSWPAVIAGAFVTAALAFILLALGTGIGMSSISPWAGSGASGKAVGAGAILWFVLIEIIACSMGGYLAGRLRTKWVNVHTHEVYFRDTAHGFLVWAVSLVMTAAFLASAATSIVTGRTNARESSSQTGTGPEAYFVDYFVDMLLRSPNAEISAALRNEITVIFANALREEEMPPADKTYLTKVIAAKAGVSEVEAGKRVDDDLGQARLAANAARKAIAHSLYWSFLAMLVGAFSASFAATIGGKQRDKVVVV